MRRWARRTCNKSAAGKHDTPPRKIISVKLERITSIKGITLDLIDENFQNHSFLISTLIQGLKKFSQKNAQDRVRKRIFNVNQGP